MSTTLITPEDYFKFRDGSKYDPSKYDDPLKDRAITFIEAALAECERFCNRKFEELGTAITEVFTGDGTDTYFVKQCRIADVQSNTLALKYWSGTAWTTLTYTMAVSDSRASVWISDGNVFSAGVKYQLTYKYGYTRAQFPADIKHKLMQLVQRLEMKAETKEGLKSESFGDTATSYDLGDLPKDILNVWKTYKAAI